MNDPETNTNEECTVCTLQPKMKRFDIQRLRFRFHSMITSIAGFVSLLHVENNKWKKDEAISLY